MFIRELSSRLPTPTLVAASTVNPGSCHSCLTREVESNPLFKFAVRTYKGLVARATEMGSRTLVHAAIEPNERERHGRYLSSCEVAEESDYTLSAEGREVSKRLWVRTCSFLTTMVLTDIWLNSMRPLRSLETSTPESIQLCLSTSFRKKHDLTVIHLFVQILCCILIAWKYVEFIPTCAYST